MSDALDFLSLPGAAIQTEDRVLVIAGGIDGVSCWGDILANAAKVKGVRGTVIDGFSRDIEANEEIAYPVYGRGATMVSARNRVVQVASGTPPRRRACPTTSTSTSSSMAHASTRSRRSSRGSPRAR
jgi:regulator of ribonuclease E activity RraA/HMG-CHA aldolase family protein